MYSGVETITVETTSGNEFDFVSFYINAFGGGFASVEGFRDGSSVGTQSTGSGFGQANGSFTVTLNNNPFDNVDKVVITSNSSGYYDVFDSFVFNTVPDITPPTVSSVNSSTANGTYKLGDVITVQVNFSENVNVTGTPQLTLETGSTDRTINYTSGTGTSTLNFNYTVQAGDISADLDYVATTSLTLNGGTIMDAASNNATLTLASPGAAGSLGANKALVIDGVVPTVTSVNSSTANGIYKVGDAISIQVNFSEAITVTGTPQLTLETGTTDRAINYTSGSGTSTLTFSYTVQVGDNSADLDYVATTSLSLNGGTIRDAATNNATLTLASPGAANSLGANKALVVDGVVPSVTSVNSSTADGAYKAGDVISIQVNFSETVTVDTGGGTPQLTLETGATDRAINYASGSNSSTLTFNYTIQAGDNSADLDYVGINSLALNSGTIRDAANNNATLTLAPPGAANSLGANKALVVDGVAPNVISIAPTGSPTANAASMDFAVTFDESVGNISTDDFTLVTTGTAAGSIGSVSATSGSNINVAINTISGTGTLKLNLNGSTNIADAAGNGIAAYVAGTVHNVDRDAPAPPSTPDLDDASDTGASNTDNYTSDNTPTFNGTAEANATVTVISSISGTLGTTVADGSGNWSYTAGAMVNGIHNITATATDAANNVSSVSAALTVTIDGPVTVTTNSDAGADATIDGSLATDIADGGGLSLREALAYVAASGRVDFAAGLSGTTITLGAPLSVPSNITLDADALGTATITGSTFTPLGSLTITNGSGDSLTLESELTSVGALTKTGAGRLTLTNTNNSTSYSGGVTVMAGELSIGSDDVFSSGSLTLNGGTLTNNTASFTFDNAIVLGASGGTAQVVGAGQTLNLSGSISGSGALSKTSGGNLTLSGSNSFSGGLSIAGTNGVTAADSTNLGSGTVTINASSLLTLTGTAQTIINAINLAGDATISNANAMTISGIVSGASALTKAGAGTLTLSAANTTTGAVSVTAGGLVLANGSALTDSVAVSVSAGASVILPSGSETVGSLTGAGSLVLTSGTLTTGSNNSSTTFSGVVSGAGSLVKAGTGTFILSGTSTFSGATQVSAGTLLVTGNIAPSSGVTVASGATLGGTGTVAAVSVANGGNLSPGNAGPGLINIAGNLLLNSGANLLLDITGTSAATQYDQLNVTGTVTLTGAAISATHSYVAANGDSYEVIINDGVDAINGTFSGIAEGDVLVAGGNSSNLLVSYMAGSGNELSLTNNLLPGAPTGVSAVAGVSSATIAFSIPTVTGGSAITGYTVTSIPGGAVQTGATSPITVTGLTNGTQYTFTVTATNGSGTGMASSPSNPVTPRGIQTITFSNPGAQNFGTTPTLTAISDSGLTPTFTSSTTGVCTITSGGNLAFVTAGTCTINADQSGDASYLPATQVSRSFTVNAVVPGAPVIGTATAGDAQASVSFTAPGFSGGAPISGYTLVSTPGGITASGGSSPIVISGLTNGTSYSFTVAATNSAGLGSASSASNTVKPNGAPVINGTPTLAVNQGALYNFAPVATDSPGDSLTFSINQTISWLTFNSATGALSGTPSNQDVGVINGIVISVSDGSLSASLPPFNLSVINVNDAPTISSTALTSATQDAAYSYTLVATDSDVGDSVTLSAVTLPSWLSFNAATGVLSGTPTNANVGSHAVVLRATDVDGLTADQSFTIVVANVNDAPTISSTALTSATQDAAYSYTLVATDSDVGDSLTLSAVTLPSWLSFNAATGVLSGTPTNANVGSHAVVLRATDVDGLTADQSFTIVVANVNDAPTISSTALTSATQDAAYSYTLVATDSDVGDSLTLSAVTLPSWLSFNAATGVLSGTPTNANVGSHAVVLRATDVDGLTADQSFTIVVANVNDAPTISSTALTSATQDAAYSYTLVATDSDVGDSLTLSAVTLPSWLSFNAASGVLSGTPTNANVGSHVVVLRATDGDGLTIDQSFTIVVANVNDAPTISSTALTSATQDAAYSYTLVATDSDVGDSLTLSAVTLPSWLSFNAASGVLSGTPTNANVGSHVVVLRATDGDGLTIDQSFTIVVANVNDAPTISSTALTSATQDAAYSYTLVATDSDVGDSLTLSAVTLPSWLSFNAASGVLSGTPTNANVGSHVVVLRATDGDGLTIDQSFTIVVANVNDAPTISSTAITSATQDAAYSYTLVATDSDVGDSLTLSAVTLPSWLNFNTATGVLSGTPTNANVGSYAVVLRATDVDGLTADQSFTIVVANVNDAPTISSTALTSATQDAAYSYTLVATDSDVGDSLTLSAVTLPSWLSFNAASGVLSGTPTNANVGSHVVVLRATDGDGLTIDQSFTIVVANVNDAPTISSTAITSATQDAAYSYTLVATDSDVGDSLTLSAVTLPSWLNFNTATGVLSGTPTNANVGSYAVVLRATDVDGLTADQSFTIVVANVNDAPTISSTAITSATQDAAYSYTLVATDSDVGDSLTLSAVTLPSWLSFNAATGVLSGTPTNANVGSYAVVLRATDVDGLTADQSFTIVVANVNDAPTISSTAITSATQDAAYSYTLVATDSDVGDSLTLSAVTLPSWLNFNTATGVLSGTPTNANVGSYAVVLRATDVDGLTADQSFTIVVANVNDAPTISSTAITSATQDAAYSYTLVATDSDVGDSLTLSAVTLPSWLSFNAATGVLSGTPTNANVGSYAVVLRATDVDGLTADQSFTIVVANVNDAPTISSTAITSATQDAAYSYTLVATDSDVGDSLTLSAVTLPSWLSFNAATGVLSGTPTNANVGSYAVLLRATDVDGLTADQSFTIAVANVNDAPVATNQTVTLEEDSSLMITLAAEDADNDPLTYEITAQPASGTLEQHGSVWLYTPEKDFNGTDSIGFIAKDAELSSEPATVTITVTPVNDDPQAVDDSYTLTSTPNDTYTLAVLANDVDVDGDTLTIDGAAADIGSVQITSDGLSFTAPEAYVGPVALRYTISDGNKGRATAKVNVLIEGTDSASQPVITLPDDVEVNATGLFTRVKLGFAKAVDRNGHPLPVSLVNKSLFFAPGNYLAYWQAVDGEGNKAIKAQKVKVNPLISLSKDQVVAEGNQVTVSVHLNGEAPSYPLSIPFTVSGSADSSDHDLVDGVVEITSGQMAEIHFTTLNDGVTEGDEEVLISLDPSLNLGSKQQTQVVITEANIAPQVSLAVAQAGQQQVIVAQNGGDVHIRATASDANEQDTLTLTWASGALSLQADATGMAFSPAAVSPGIYPVSLTVTDDGSPVLSSTETVYIVVRPSLVALTSADTDGDLIPDNQEGYSDSDSDGIPDYLDANNDCNVMPEGELQPVYFLAEGQAGVCLRLGNIALSRGQSGVQLQPEAVAEDALADNVGGIFDFIATGLPQQGQSYSLVLPQRSPVPANAVYRKFNAQAGWRDFVIDANNTVASTEGERGFCPPPGDSRWTPGLTEGHWCVQLTIEDGGPNDDDGVANRTIVDPSGVAVMLNGNHLPVANPDSAAIAWNQSVDVNVLANDTDSDGDSLSVTQVISEFGTVTVLADQRLSYMPAADFIGTDVLVYSITDGKGGTASSELTIVVNGNTAPVTVDDSAATDDRTSLLIDVLSNDTDVDGNTLTLLSATAQQGTVTIEANKLRYIPKTGFDGVDTVTYRISDGQGGEATGQVLITVKAYQEVIIDNKSGGGSMTLWALAFILACAMLRRRELQRFALGSLLLLSVTQQAQATDWYVEGFIGQAQADKTLPELNVQVGEGQLLNVDDSDTAFGVSLGYQWTPTAALELGYADFGEGSARIKGSTLTPEQYHELVKTVTPVLADGVMLGLRFTLLQHQGWRFEVPVGLFHWQADISSTMGNTTIKTDLDGTDWYAGVRFSYQFSDAWSVGLGYQYIDIEPNDLLSYQLNLRYQF
nr:putative Ig domain-containing protein [Shewanella mangrovisoli]